MEIKSPSCYTVMLPSHVCLIRIENVSKTYVAFTRQQISDTFRKRFSWSALSKTH